MKKALNIQFEKAVRLLVENLPISDESSRKPILFHDIRVGVYLYENGYDHDIVLAGLLHDAIEWSTLTEAKLSELFGDNVVRLILASTKDRSIIGEEENIKELINRCIQNGQDALIIKTADILDSYKWYTSQDNKDELGYCARNANAILTYKPDDFTDDIFEELAKAELNIHEIIN